MMAGQSSACSSSEGNEVNDVSAPGQSRFKLVPIDLKLTNEPHSI